MSVRRLHHEQPESFAFTKANQSWAKKQVAKFPAGRQASAVIPLLWQGQLQEGWVSEPMIRTIADMLDMPYIRVLEVATFYTMFQLQPVGAKAHIQVCGTTPCMLRGAEDLKKVCQRKIHHDPHTLSEDGNFSWEEVECLGACVNAPMIQIVKDTYEDLTPESFEQLIDDIAAGREITPGPQVERQFSAPIGGVTSLTEAPGKSALKKTSASKATAKKASGSAKAASGTKTAKPKATAKSGANAAKKAAIAKGKEATVSGTQPQGLKAARGGEADNLRLISGVGPKIEGMLHSLGIFHFDQIAAWKKAEREWVDGYLKFKGRIEREDWVKQAKTLAKGGETEFSKRTKKSSGKGK